MRNSAIFFNVIASLLPNSSMSLSESLIGGGQILECIYFTHFLIYWMLRSFKYIEISLSPGVETLSKDSDGPMRAEHRTS